jgi:hypothetical protein
MSTIPFRQPPLGPDLGPTIDRLKAMAAAGSDALPDGPVHPDAQLLELCADIADARKVADTAFWRQWDVYMSKPRSPESAKAAAASDEAYQGFAHLLRNAAKIKATTAAGIYAKALAVRSSKTGAKFLAMSLADDFLACEGLRASLWPAREEG